MSAPRLLDAGEAALVVEFGDAIDPGTNARVLALDEALAADPPAGLVECVPTYRSLMIHYDPLVLPRRALVAAVERALLRGGGVSGPQRLWRIPACYDPEFAEDIGVVAAATGLAPEAVNRLHAGAEYQLYMFGFAPGWAYLGGLPKALALPRRASPRALIPAGSLIVAGGQAIIAGPAMPSGWHILGRTPERMFNAARDPVFLLAVGDRVTFDPISLAEFHAMDRRAAAGEVLSRAEALA